MPQTGKKRECLAQASRDRPEYRAVLSVFLELFAFIDGREGETGISFDLPEPDRAARTAAGSPLLSPGAMRVDAPAAAAFLSGVVGALRRAGREGGEHLDAVLSALSRGALDPASLFAACLERQRKPVEEAAAAAAVPAPLLAFILQIPLKTSLELFAETVGPDAFEGWMESRCPVCGGRPGMDELAGEEGRRYLCCSGCATRWPFKRIQCPYCGCSDPALLSYFAPGEEPTRVSVCRKCSRYIKTRDSRRGNALVPLEAEDLMTIHLDLLAAKEGFERGA